MNDDIHAKREYDAKTQGIVTRTKKTFIFPRYHQLAVVRALLKQVRDDGPGQNYLVEHSAGNGKSNSIAWLAYRLSSSYRSNEAKERIFDPVIVVTDRRVLDRQLTFTDTELEKLDVYTVHLMEKLPGRKSVLPRQVLNEVDLDSYGVQHKYTQHIGLAKENVPQAPVGGRAGAALTPEQLYLLSNIVKFINDTYGADLTDEDKVHLGAMKDQLMGMRICAPTPTSSASRS